MFDNWRLKRTKKVYENKNEKLISDDKINLKKFETVFCDSTDVRFKEVAYKDEKLYLIYIDNLVDICMINDSIVHPITHECDKEQDEKTSTFKKIESGLIPNISVYYRNKFKDSVSDILNGYVCLIDIKNNSRSITFDVKKINKRNITEPTNENIIKGSKESFIENIKVNISLIRNRMKNSNLKVREINIGDDLPTRIAIVYLDDKVDKKILEQVITRVKTINTSKGVTLSDIEEQIVDNKYSIFPQVLYSEKTDKIASNISDGKICLIIDGFPVVYIVPAVFNMFFQTPEDYSVNYVISTSLRILRYICIIITVLAPAFYIAISTFHQEMIPTQLAISIIESKQGDPFPVLVEVMFMLLSFEVLIEASIRLPKTIGQTISIIGGLIIGEAAVNANFVSPAVVVIIAISGIAGFLMPNQDFANALRICRFLFVIASGIAGLFGVTMAMIIFVYVMSTTESFGVPYFIPFTSIDSKNIMIDTFVRAPMEDMKKNTKG